MTMLCSAVEDPKRSPMSLNNELMIFNQWANHWKMEFNPGTTKQAKEVLFPWKIPQFILNKNLMVLP